MKKRTALITGASRGIGQAIVQLLQQSGYQVFAPPRKDLNLLSRRSIDRFLDRHEDKPFDILINNAGVNQPEWIDQVNSRNLTETAQVNLLSPIRLISAVVPSMKRHRWGRIVNISSIFGVIARSKQVLYSATKHGLNGVTKALALELGPHNILVNSVCPGFTDTELVRKNPPEKIAAIERDIPLGRLAQPEEIARLVAFLVSENNTYITGATLVIDGGYTCQ